MKCAGGRRRGGRSPLLIGAPRETPFRDRHLPVVDPLVGTENGCARAYGSEPSPPSPPDRHRARRPRVRTVGAAVAPSE
ncbi:darcynin family protein [Streptomyces sp. NPDC017940]|uniref:darcynin family protein n=1 Tax=Streptomyces sp. NPDC017940 TaxID=3365017 RepID=UPI00379954DB